MESKPFAPVVIELSEPIPVGEVGADISVYTTTTPQGDNRELMVGDDIYLPKEYMLMGFKADVSYRVIEAFIKPVSDYNRLYLCRPYSPRMERNENSYYKIDREVPKGTKLMTGSNNY